MDQISFADRSANPGAEVERRLKNVIIKACENAANDTMTAVCQEIASNAMNATYPTGTKFSIE